MHRRFPPIAAILALLALPLQAAALTLEGIRIPERIVFQDVTFSLNGAGVRKKFFVEAYVACLYLTDPSEDPEYVLAADEPQTITLHIVSDLVTRKRLAKAAERDMRKVYGSLESIQPQVDKFMGLFADEVAKGDVFKLVYLPGAGTRVIKNERELAVIPGLNFKKALFGVWLSAKNPAVDGLRKDLFDREASRA